jgi:hypothetical protein
VPVGPTSVRIMPLNFNFVLPVVLSLATVTFIKAISASTHLRVIFDEDVFPFAQLSSTVGAKYSSEVLLLPGQSSTWASTEAPLDNSPVISCLPNPLFVTNQLLP